MARSYRRRTNFLTGCAAASLAWTLITPSFAAEGTPQVVAQAGAPPAAGAVDDRQLLLQRLQQFEQRLNQLESARGVTPPPATPANPAAPLDTQAILDRLDALDQRITGLETGTVLSEPKTIVKQVEVYVDQNGNEYDAPGPGRRVATTYQRELVFRRQTITDSIAEALADQANNSIAIGVSSVTTVQGALQTHGRTIPANGHVYGVSQADVTFAAKSAALNTSFFADLVGIGGSPPDKEIPAINLLNNQTARLSNNQVNLREAWIKTELFGQQVAVQVGQLDLTGSFDRNTVANDETSHFISGALVNDPVLDLTNNGLGIAAVYDPRGSLNFKLGVQQSTPAATSLSSSLYTLGEVEYTVVPFGLPEGHYRLWFRLDNSTGQERTGFGVSVDQKLTPEITLFGRYGNGYVSSIGARMHFFSGGLGFQAPFALNPLDFWGIGYAQTEILSGHSERPFGSERLAEGFYNLHLTDHLALSAMLQYVVESSIKSGFLIPGVRMAVVF